MADTEIWDVRPDPVIRRKGRFEVSAETPFRCKQHRPRTIRHKELSTDTKLHYLAQSKKHCRLFGISRVATAEDLASISLELNVFQKITAPLV